MDRLATATRVGVMEGKARTEAAAAGRRDIASPGPPTARGPHGQAGLYAEWQAPA